MAAQPRVAHAPPPSEKPAAPAPAADTDARSRRSLGLHGALAVLVLGLGALSAWLYAFPDGYAGAVAGLNPRAVSQFQQHVPFHFPVSVPAPGWSLGFRLLLLTLWIAYALAVVASLRGGAPRPGVTLGAVVVASLTMGVFCPPLLTTDGYSYLGYSHLDVLYGLNPYVTTTAPLIAHGDPVTRFLFWQVPTVYGPVWTALTDAVVFCLPHSLWGQIVAVKLIEAAALIAAALAGRRIAERLQPGWGDGALLAIGLNPLLLIEGPGGGHNDLLMIALALCAVARMQEARWAWAGLLLGLSVGVKLVTLALLPWLLLDCLRRGTGRARLSAPLTLAACALLPLVIGYAAFWHGPDTLLALRQRTLYGFDSAAQGRAATTGAWLTALYQRRVLVSVYALLSVWLWRTRTGGGWLTAWAVFAPVLMFTGTGNPLPWYVTWFWPFTLLRRDRAALCLSAAFLLLALAWEGFYAYLRPV